MKRVVVSLRDVWKIYRVGKIEYPALRGVTLDVYENELLAVVGPSGSGKTTLLNLIGALDRPTRGEVYIDGVSLSTLSENELAELRNRKIGFIFQQFNLISYLTALENVELPMIAAGLPARVRREQAKRLLEEVGLGDRLYNRPIELSGGEQQRVAVARALANNPSIILADEPTGNLDSKNAHQLLRLFRRLVDEGKATIVLVTHNLELTQYCNRVAYLRDGRIERVVTS